MIVRLLEMHGLRVFTNRSTANIQQGLLSAVLEQANFSGKLAADIAVLEVDEGHLRSLLQLKPRLAVLTNVLSDQLDRFNDPSRVIARLAEVSKQVEKVVINGDDPNLNQLPFSKMPLVAGLSASLLKSKSAPRYAFNFRKPVAFERDISVFASNGFELRMGERKLRTASSNSQHALNDALAVLAAGQILELNYDFVEAELLSGKRVFARNETVVLNDKRVNLRLVQNPTSFQLNLDELTGEETPLMMMAGADIHDPSWLWTVDFQKIKKVDIVAGSNAYDLALRLHFAGVGVGQVITDPGLAADKFLEIKGRSHTILFSADAMRRTRRHLGLAQ
jgi:UDP-N-acetylmuramoylalanine-D-glutamate ligase